MSDVYLSREQNRYAQVSPGSIYESQVGALVERNIASIFPDYFGKRYEPYLRTAAGDVQPDIVLLRRDFTGWALVAIEDEGHPFRRHILPQVSKMTYAEADEKLIAATQEKLCPIEPIARVEEAMSRRPRVFLVVHGSSARFQSELETLGVDPIDIDIHESTTQPNEYVLSVRDRTTVLTDLNIFASRSRNPITKFFWTIPSVELANALRGKDRVEVNFAQSRSMWNAVYSDDGLILRQPSDLSLAGSIVTAKVFLNEESSAIFLVP